MDETTVLERTFTVEGPAHLRLANTRGRVEIRAGEPGVIAIKAVRHNATGQAEQTTIEMEQDEAGRVRVETRFPDGWLGWIFGRHHKPCKVDYSVSVPRDCSVHLSVVSAPAVLAGLNGELRLQTVSGDLRLDDVEGTLSVNTVSAGVSGRRVRLSAPLKLDTVSGDVTLLESAMPGAEASSVSGQLQLETALGEGPYRFSSVSGDVRLRVPPGTRCALDLTSLSGRIRSSVNTSGGPRVRLHSVSGDLWVVADQGGQQPLEDAAPVRARPRAGDRLATLERVARGELTVDEALAELH